MKKQDLFNPSGDDRIENRQMIGGNTTNLFNLNESKYNWSKKFYRVMLGNTWFPEKVNMSADRVDYQKLTDNEKKTFKSILSFLTFLDSIQTNNIPNVFEWITAPEIKSLLTIQQYQEMIHCYSKDTEILTEYGWKLFKDLNFNDLVAQYHPNGDISFVKPLDIIKSKYNGKMININNNIYQSVVTPNHRVVYNDYYTKTVRVKEAISIGLNNHTIPVAGNAIGCINSLSIRDRLKIAYQADGIILNNGNFTKDGVCYRFYVKKQRKIDKLINLCQVGNLKHTVKDSKPDGFKSIYIWFPELFTKDFDEYNLSLYSSKWCKEFIQELSIYDGTPKTEKKKHLRYFNTNKKVIDKVMAIGSLANYRIGFYTQDGRNGFGKYAENPKDCYYLNFIDTNYVTGRGIKKEYIDYDDDIYCVTVPTGMVVVRLNNRITISGNSQSYSYIIESVIPKNERNEVYELWRENEFLLKRNKTIAGFYQDFINNQSKTNFYKVLIANYILESVFFYNGFIFFYSLLQDKKMMGTGDQIRYISLDEKIHIELFANIINEVKNEVKDWLDDETIISMFKDAVELELEWNNSIFKDNLHINNETTKAYVHHLVNISLSKIGIDNIYDDAYNPYKKLEEFSGDKVNNMKSNFFESTVTNYSQSTTLNNWNF